ncbi:LysR family transcriptional regulator [Paraliomyxa miuraensis]|uniref:LysR family transcriptional regulator n=1 Tax=Paraliomyxa miuraensis TaxID=376150 RepID=UPI002255D9F1|nr:LysR family transcriptional regulator [Paraliomyxa miuraensis]MCX4242473.1 LysR family transcriptional regulator [Paraliomyxa miuraensis]
MERLRRVTSLWSWLPAFRAVAETQHLPTASSQLFVSASALSRTIRLLEDDVGRRLFLRNGRRIELNEAGQRLLVAVRNAMRIVHEGLLAIEGAELAGPVYVSTAGLVTTAHLLPALRRLRREQPELVPHVLDQSDRDVGGLLLRGEIDVALVTQPLVHPQLTKLHLGAARSGIYCGPGHPLHGVHALTEAKVLEHAFVALSPDERGVPQETWPPTLDRRVGMVVSQLWTGLEVCASGELLAVLPDAIAGAPTHREHLFRLPLEVVPPTDLFALHRATLIEGGRAEAVAAAVARELAATSV